MGQLQLKHHALRAVLRVHMEAVLAQLDTDQRDVAVRERANCLITWQSPNFFKVSSFVFCRKRQKSFEAKLGWKDWVTHPA